MENLASNLWQKAEYVTRETERRRCQQIFVENFIERFRELKPDLSALPIDSISALLQPSAIPPAQQTDETAVTPKADPPTVQQAAVETRQDEYLGIIKTDNQFVETRQAPSIPVETAETIEKQDVQLQPVNVSAPLTTNEISQNKPFISDHSISENNSTNISNTQTRGSIVESEEVAAVPTEIADPPPTPQSGELSPKTVETSVKAQTPVKSATQTASKPEDEPFEFGKCKVCLNLVLLPCVSSAEARQVIISAASHELPPEIEFLEIAGGEDLEQIAGLVKNKLHRFVQTLPVKYMEKLRAAKAKTVKNNQSSPKQITNQPATGEKSSGGQSVEVVNSPAAMTIDSQLPLSEAVNPAPNAATSPQQSLF